MPMAKDKVSIQQVTSKDQIFIFLNKALKDTFVNKYTVSGAVAIGTGLTYVFTTKTTRGKRLKSWFSSFFDKNYKKNKEQKEHLFYLLCADILDKTEDEATIRLLTDAEKNYKLLLSEKLTKNLSDNQKNIVNYLNDIEDYHEEFN